MRSRQLESERWPGILGRSERGTKTSSTPAKPLFSWAFRCFAMRLLHPLFALLASVTKQELARQVAYLKVENRIQRARL